MIETDQSLKDYDERNDDAYFRFVNALPNCPSCNGSGFVDCGQVARECANCNGSGKIYPIDARRSKDLDAFRGRNGFIQ